MKSVNLGVKLIGGFVATVVIIVVVGVNARYQQGKLFKNTEKLVQDCIPGMHSILNLRTQQNQIASLTRTLLTPFVSKEQRQRSEETLNEAKRLCAMEEVSFSKLSVATAVKVDWQEYRDAFHRWDVSNIKAIELSEQLIKEDMTNPVQLLIDLADFDAEHQQIISQFRALFLTGTPLNEELIEKSCSLDAWIIGSNTSNERIKSLINELIPLDKEFHEAIAEIRRLYANDGSYDAEFTAKLRLYPTAETIFAKLHEIKEISSVAYDRFKEMNRILLTDGSSYQTKTLSTLDRIADRLTEYSQNTVNESRLIRKEAEFIELAGITFGTIVAITLGLVLTFIITRPLRQGVAFAEKMAAGDLTGKITIERGDEIGYLINSLNGMSEKLRSLVREAKAGILNVDEASDKLTAVAGSMAAGAKSAANHANMVVVATNEMSENQSSIADAIEQASAHANMVASAIQGMNATVRTIAHDSSKAREITGQAVNQSRMASTRVDDLGKAADSITKVTETISEISELTNLLALNATIEAGRAGEAGRGFAVVANEIKELARQTAIATHEINEQIVNIQTATSITVNEISEIGIIISDIDELVSRIARAVEEQSFTTENIAKSVGLVSSSISAVSVNVSQASVKSVGISAEINDVSARTEEIRKGSDKVKESADQLARIAKDLKATTSAFSV